MAEETPSAGPQSGPSRIGRYRILARVGRGGMGVVYSAVDEALGRTIALKVLMADLESDPQTRARFYREAQAAARLLHPNIITVYDAGEEQGRSYIAMQLLHGAPLPIYLRRPEAIPIERKLDLMVQVCEGLAVAHAAGIIHRDLKPNNLYVQDDGLLKILDFGIARFADSSMTAAGTMLGTPDYMSPEQARGDHVDARSDIFSVGAVFHFMLSGRKPFPGPALPAVLHQLQFDQPEPLTGVPPALADLIAQTMAKQAADRPPRVEHVLGALVRFRRQYQGETRRLAFGVRAAFDEVERLTGSLDAAGAVLRLGDPEPAAVLQRLREEFPAFGTRTNAVNPATFERAAVSAAAEAVDAARARLTALLEGRSADIAMLQQGEEALAAGDAERALQAFERVLSACPRAARAQELAEASRPLAREQRRRADRVDQLVEAARVALAADDWTAAQQCCQEALGLGDDPAVASLLAEAERGLAQHRHRLAIAVQRVVERASNAIERRAFDEAEAILSEGDLVQSDTTAIAMARRVLDDARAAAAAEERLHQRSTDEIRKARSMFRRGRYDAAVEGLRSFVDEEPAARAAADELGTLEWLKASMTAAFESAQARAHELLSTASALAAAGLLDEAVQAAERAVAEAPTDGQTAAVLDDLLRRQLEARLAQERTRTGELRLRHGSRLLAAARDALEHGYLAVAQDAADAARRIAPDHPELRECVARIRHEMASDDQESFTLTPLRWPDADTGNGPAVDGRGRLDGATELLGSRLKPGQP